MQKVVSILPSWGQTKTTSKKGFDKAWAWADKLGAPVNRLTNKIGSEAFWPTTLDKESDKAARILKSFCKDGFYAEEEFVKNEEGGPVGPKAKQKVLKKIPQDVIKNAVGLAIFTTMRTGLWVSGAGGSGVLVARKEDGSWSPPSGILLHTAGLGFLVGVDIYDCVVVINNRKALDAFTHVRATLGGEISAVAGPVGVGGILENDGKWKQANRPVFTYLKSRGFYAGVQVDGTVIIERSDENERFYGERISCQDILKGKARHPPYEIKMLMETIKSAEGRTDVDRSVIEELADQPAPGDVEVESPSIPTFGIPEPDDPDPFGVHALEDAGFFIREAGSNSRPSSAQFEYKPSPTSPVFAQWNNRRSVDTFATKSNRGSYMSNKTRNSTDRGTQTTSENAGTQTESPSTSPSLDSTEVVPEAPEVDYTKIDMSALAYLSTPPDMDGTTIVESPFTDTEALGIKGVVEEMESLGVGRQKLGSVETSSIFSTVSNENGEDESGNEDEEDDGDVDEDDDEEEVVVYEAAAAQASMAIPTVITKGSLVTIPRRSPPALPPRSPARLSKSAPLGEERIGSPESQAESKNDEGFEEVTLDGDSGKSIAMDKQEKGFLEIPSQEEDTDSFHSMPATPEMEHKPVEATA
jgi:lipid-binding SYLF domain-containing protein